MPTYRTRNRDRKMTGSGKAIRLPSNLTFYSGFSPIVSDYEYFADHTQPPPFKNPTWMNKSRSLSIGGTISGSCAYGYAGGGTVSFADNVRPQNRTGAAYAPETTVVDFGYWKTKALANLDVDRPVVDLPLFLFELRELPRQLRDLGRVLNRGRGPSVRPSDLPGQHLAYQFGWAPLVSDLVSMLGLQRQLDNRIRYFKNLAEGTRVKRRLATNRLIRDTVTVDGYKVFNVGPAGAAPWALVADIHIKEYLSVWFSANAVLIDSLPEGTSLPTRSLRSLLGLTSRPSTLWNAMPWSWMIDYFTNVGDYIEARQGMTRVRTTNMCIMAHSVVTSELTQAKLKPGLSLSNSRLIRERKQRSVSLNPQPSLFNRVPFMTNGHRAILGSLGTATAIKQLARGL